MAGKFASWLSLHGEAHGHTEVKNRQKIEKTETWQGHRDPMAHAVLRPRWSRVYAQRDTIVAGLPPTEYVTILVTR